MSAENALDCDRVAPMATREDVEKLASLARIEVSSEDIDRFVTELDAILAYVGQLDELSVTREVDTEPELRNVMRDDNNPHEEGLYTKKLVEAFPKKEDEYLSVKKIISYD